MCHSQNLALCEQTTSRGVTQERRALHFPLLRRNVALSSQHDPDRRERAELRG
jgi:hypothetical protein